MCSLKGEEEGSFCKKTKKGEKKTEKKDESLSLLFASRQSTEKETAVKYTSESGFFSLLAFSFTSTGLNWFERSLSPSLLFSLFSLSWFCCIFVWLEAVNLFHSLASFSCFGVEDRRDTHERQNLLASLPFPRLP